MIENTPSIHSIYMCAGHQLLEMIMGGVERMSLLGFRINCAVCDGASENRALMKMWHSPEAAQHFCQLYGLGTIDKDFLSVRRHPVFPSQPFIFLGDVPHATKKARNNLEKSCHRRSKKGGWTREIQVSNTQ